MVSVANGAPQSAVALPFPHAETQAYQHHSLGTWCDRTTRRGTVIGKLDRMLVNDLYQVKRYVKGIGSSHSVVEKYIGGK
jgi:hypothetical protein